MFATTSIVCSQKSQSYETVGIEKSQSYETVGIKEIMSSGITIKKFFTLLRKTNIAFLCISFFYNISFPSWPILYSRDWGAPIRTVRALREVLILFIGDCYIRIVRASRIVLFLVIGNCSARAPHLYIPRFARSISLIFGSDRAPLSQIHRFVRDPFNILCKCVKIELHAH